MTHLPEDSLIEILARALWCSAARNGIIAVPADMSWDEVDEVDQERWTKVAATMIDTRDVINMTVRYTRVAEDET